MCFAPLFRVAVQAGSAVAASVAATKREKHAAELFAQQDKKNAGKLKKCVLPAVCSLLCSGFLSQLRLHHLDWPVVNCVIVLPVADDVRARARFGRGDALKLIQQLSDKKSLDKKVRPSRARTSRYAKRCTPHTYGVLMGQHTPA